MGDDLRYWWIPSPRGEDIGSGDADSVELKVLLSADPETVAAALTGRPRVRWRVRQMHLLDTPDLALARTGLEMRLRRRARGRHDLTVRARDPWAGSVAGRPRGARVEVDVLPGAAWRTTELRRDLDETQAAAWAEGRAEPSTLFSSAQQRWARQRLGAGRAERLGEDLVVHGPLLVHRARVPLERFPAARARLEHCRYPSGRALLEFSARCVPARASCVAEAMAAFLDEHGVAVAVRQQTKTAMWIDDLVRRG